MGSRAGITVIDADGTVELFYDHWAAQTLGQDAALAGFASTLDRVRSMEPMGEPSVQEWTSATWMEGSMLIDIPNRRLVWSEEGEALVLPRIVNYLIEQTWPGWTAVWAPEGVHGVIHLAGADPLPLFAGRSVVERGNLANYEWFAPGPDQFIGAPLSVRLDSGEVVLWRTDADLDGIACYGPDDIIAFAHRASDQGACGDGWGSDWALVDEDGIRVWAERGVHVDVPTRTLTWWTLFEGMPCDGEFAAYWQGWTVRGVGDGYEWHEQRLGGIPLQKQWSDQVEQARDHFVRLVNEGPRRNPFRRMAGALVERGHEVTPLPGVLQFVPSTEFGGVASILTALDTLVENQPLPPARFVDIHGAVHEPSPRDLFFGSE